MSEGEPDRKGFLRDPFALISLWRESAASRSARWQLVKVLPDVSVMLTVAAGLAILIYVGTALAFITLIGATVGALPEAIEFGFDSPEGRHLLVLLSLVAVVIVVQHCWAPWHAALLATLARRVDLHFRERVMRTCLGPRGIWHLEDPELLDLVRDAGGIGDARFTPGAAVTGMADAATNRLTCVQAAVVVGLWRWWLGAGLLALGFLMRYRVARDTMRTVSTATGQTGQLRRADYLRDMVLTSPGAKEVRVFGLGGWVLGRFRDSWLSAMTGLWDDRRHHNASSWSWSIPWGIAVGLGLYYVGRSGLDGDVSLGHMAVLAQAVLTASSVYLGNHDLQMAYGASTVPAALSLEERVHDSSPTVPTSDPAGAPSRDIRFDDVSFRYPRTDRDVLRGLNLTIPAGDSLAVVGANGAGKTTLVKLLTRLYEPTSGRILVDGIGVDEFDARAWQRRVGAIFQDFVRYQLPARSNIGFGAVERQADLDAIVAAADAAGARERIEALPAGWDTVLSREYTEGGELSGGEWQRIALARALFAVAGGAGVLVLDEPTANLDVRAEAALFDQFLDLTRGVTTILISHRFSSVRRASQICVLDGGRIVEMGTHDELLALDGNYARMYGLQAARFADDGMADADAVDVE